MNKNIKRVIAYVAIVAVLLPVWIHWGGFKCDMGTLIIAIAGASAALWVEDKLNQPKVKTKAE